MIATRKRIGLGWRVGLAVFSVTVLLLSNCLSVRLIADYDEVTDRSITEIQKKMELFLAKMEREVEMPSGSYEGYATFYDEVEVEISAARTRAMAMPKNEITVEEIDTLRSIVLKVENMHKAGLKSAEIAPLRSAIVRACTAIIRLELAKKRGERNADR